jgi:tetratricopeptide (TPR) repeat protein
MKRLLLALLLSALGLSQPLKAQLPAYYEPFRLYKDAQELFAKEKYGPAYEKLQAFLAEGDFDTYEHSNELNANAHFYQAVSAYHLNRFDTEPLLKRFIANFPQNSKWTEAHYFLGKSYFEQKKYKEAMPYLKAFAETQGTQEALQQEASFMLAYAHFYENDYATAQPMFQQVSQVVDHPFAEDARYYNAIILYQQGQYGPAYDAFKELEYSDKYRNEIRVYLANCMLKLKRYAELFTLADELANDPKAQRNDAEVYFIVANASYERDDYAKAARYFRDFETNGGKLGRHDYFRFAQSHYKLKQYPSAIPLYRRVLETERDSLTQIASYYLGFCYLETDNKNNARVAFEKAAKAKDAYSDLIKQDALYQYGKVCISTKYYEEAYKSLRTLEKNYPNNANLPEVRSLIGELLFYSKNYKQAVAYLESVPRNTERSMRAYQIATFYYGTRLFDRERYQEADVYFEKAAQNDYDKNMALSAQYWLGESRFRQQAYDASLKAFRTYLQMPQVKKHEYYLMAIYGIAWNHFKKKEYSQALKQFDSFINQSSRSAEPKNLVDAYLRAGDCLFLQRQYGKANTYYQRVIDFNYTYVDYAMYQIAESQYRQREYQQSVQEFDKLITRYKRSELRDDALDRVSEIYATWIKDYEKADQYAKMLVEEYPKSPLAGAGYNRRALAAYYRNDLDGAIKYFKKVVEDYGFDKESAQTALENLSAMIDPAEYDKIFKAYKEKNPEVNFNAELLYNTGMDRYYAGSYTSAINQFTEYIDGYPNAPNYHEALVFRARAHQQLGQSDKALDDYSKVFNTKPKNNFTNVALLEAAEIKVDQQNFEAALQLYTLLEQTAEKLENRTEAAFGIAKCHLALGNYADAERVMQPIASNPQQQTLTQERAQVQIGNAQYGQKRLEAAFQTFKKVESENKTELGAESQYMITRILYDQGKFQETRESGLYLQNTYPTYNRWKAQAFLVVARADYALGDNFQAKGVLESLISNSEFPDITRQARELLDKILKEEEGGR